MLDPSLRLHPYLFEHHAGNDFLFFAKTFVGQLKPRRFWKLLHPNQPSVPARLVRYWNIVAVGFLSTVALVLAAVVPESINLSRGYRVSLLASLAQPSYKEWKESLVFQYGSIEGFMDEQYPITVVGTIRTMLFNPSEPVWVVLLILFAWPWLTILALMIFKKSMRKARLKSGHLVRIVVYNSDAIFWLCAYCIAATTAHLVLSKLFFASLDERVVTGLLVAFVASSLLWLYRLAVAFTLYLRIDRPILTALTSQLLVAFFAFDIVMFVLFGW